MLQVLFWFTLLAVFAAFLKVVNEREQLKKDMDRYSSIRSPEQHLRELNTAITVKQNQLEQLSIQLKFVAKKLEEVEEEEYVQDFGFYKPKYDFGNIEQYEDKLKKIKEQQGKMLKDKTAAVCHTKWAIEGSIQKGRKSTKNFLTLMLRAFNGECDAAVAKVKYNNADSLRRRIIKSFETINKLSEEKDSEITQQYLDLKLDELDLVYGFQEQKKKKDDEQRRIREQMRDEKRAHDELEKARKEAEQEVKRREQALRQARREVAQAVGKEQERLALRINGLTQQLEEARANERKATACVNMGKSGSVYVISNIGSFGENIYKIGMTRRFDPLDRIKELSGSSVPFPFDVHAIIYSENALEMETRLHQKFSERSVNKVYERKEFFRVTLDEIEQAVREIARETKVVGEFEISFTKVAEAEQYRKTLAIERSGNFKLNTDYSSTWDEDEELDDV